MSAIGLRIVFYCNNVALKMALTLLIGGNTASNEVTFEAPYNISNRRMKQMSKTVANMSRDM